MGVFYASALAASSAPLKRIADDGRALDYFFVASVRRRLVSPMKAATR